MKFLFEFLISLLPIAIIAFIIIVDIKMFFHNLERDGDKKFLWGVLILFTSIGPIIYYFAVYKHSNKN